MKTRKTLLSLALAALMIAAFVTPALAADGDLVFKADAAAFEEFVGEQSGGTTWIQNCGGGTKTVEGGSLKITERSNDYDCIDIKTGDLDTSKVYTVFTKVRTVGGESTTFKYGMGAGPYTEYVAVEGSEATLVYTLNADFAFDKFLRVQTNGTTEDFIIDYFAIYEGELTAEPVTGGGGGGGNAKTGDNTFIFFALGLLAVAGTATVFVARKIKA